MQFLPVFELLQDSLSAIQVELHQCPSPQLILLTQGPIHEIFTKKYRELVILKNVVFLSRPFFFRIFFSHLEKPVTMKNGKNPKDVLANFINFEPSATQILIKLRSTQAFSIDKPFHKNKSIIGVVLKQLEHVEMGTKPH